MDIQCTEQAETLEDMKDTNISVPFFTPNFDGPLPRHLPPESTPLLFMHVVCNVMRRRSVCMGRTTNSCCNCSCNMYDDTRDSLPYFNVFVSMKRVQNLSVKM